jgi:adenylylsulfate kinase
MHGSNLGYQIGLATTRPRKSKNGPTTDSHEERETFYRAMAYIGSLRVTHGVPVIFDATANRRAYRAEARAAIDRFLEVYVECPLDVCVARDPQGICRKARSGEASTVPGVQAAYEPPAPADVVVSGNSGSAASAADTIVRALEDKGYIARQPVSTTP